MKCVKPLKHNPQFEGKVNCKICETHHKGRTMQDWEYECQVCDTVWLREMWTGHMNPMGIVPCPSCNTRGKNILTGIFPATITKIRLDYKKENHKNRRKNK